jgi:hypothetical protein
VDFSISNLSQLYSVCAGFAEKYGIDDWGATDKEKLPTEHPESY